MSKAADNRKLTLKLLGFALGMRMAERLSRQSTPQGGQHGQQ